MTTIAVCRLCVSCTNLSEVIDKDEHLRQKIEYCFNITIVPNDVSTKICSRCMEEVIQFNKVKLRITEADIFLRDISKLLKPGVEAYHVSKLFNRTFKTPDSHFSEPANTENVSQVESSGNEQSVVKTEYVSVLDNDTVPNRNPTPESTVTNQNPSVSSSASQSNVCKTTNIMTVIPDDVKEEVDLKYRNSFGDLPLDKNASPQREEDLVLESPIEASVTVSNESESDVVQEDNMIPDYSHLSLEGKASHISTKSTKEGSIPSSPIIPKVAKIIVKKYKDGRMGIIKPKKHKLRKKRRLSHKLKRKINSNYGETISLPAIVTSIPDSVRVPEVTLNLSEEDNISSSSVNSSILLSASSTIEEVETATDIGNMKKLVDARSDLSSVQVHSANKAKSSFVPNVSLPPISTSFAVENIVANINNSDSLLDAEVVSSMDVENKSKSPSVNHSDLMEIDVINESGKCNEDYARKHSMTNSLLTVNTKETGSKGLNLLPVKFVELDTHPVLNGALDEVINLNTQHSDPLEMEDTSPQLLGTSCLYNTPLQKSLPAVENNATAENIVATGDSDSIHNLLCENVGSEDTNVSAEPYFKISTLRNNETAVVNNCLGYPENFTSSSEVFSDLPSGSTIDRNNKNISVDPHVTLSSLRNNETAVVNNCLGYPENSTSSSEVFSDLPSGSTIDRNNKNISVDPHVTLSSLRNNETAVVNNCLGYPENSTSSSEVFSDLPSGSTIDRNNKNISVDPHVTLSSLRNNETAVVNNCLGYPENSTSSSEVFSDLPSGSTIDRNKKNISVDPHVTLSSLENNETAVVNNCLGYPENSTSSSEVFSDLPSGSTIDKNDKNISVDPHVTLSSLGNNETAVVNKCLGYPENSTSSSEDSSDLPPGSTIDKNDKNISVDPHVKISILRNNETAVVKKDLVYPDSSTTSLEVFSASPKLPTIAKDDGGNTSELYAKIRNSTYNETSAVSNELITPESSSSSLKVFSALPIFSAIAKDDIYFCNFCPEHLKSQKNLLKHLKKFHRFECQYCKLRFNKKQQLLRHHVKVKCLNNKNDWKVKAKCNVTLLNVCDIKNLEIKRKKFKGTLKKDLLHSLKYIKQSRSEVDLRPARNVYYRSIYNNRKSSLTRAVGEGHQNLIPQGKVTDATQNNIIDSIKNSSKENVSSINAASKRRRCSSRNEGILTSTSASNSETDNRTATRCSLRRSFLANKSKKPSDEASPSTSGATHSKSKKENLSQKNKEISLIKSC